LDQEDLLPLRVMVRQKGRIGRVTTALKKIDATGGSDW